MSAYDQFVFEIYPVSRRYFPAHLPEFPPETLPEYFTRHSSIISKHPYLADLARIEYSCYLLKNDRSPVKKQHTERVVNPTLDLIPVQWSGLPDLLVNPSCEPKREEGLVMIFKELDNGAIHVETPTGHDLLAIKITNEKIHSSQAAREGNVSIGTIDDILYTAINRGLLLEPPSKLIREGNFPHSSSISPEYMSAQTFTLQWHITQKCDLHCRHCYDRSNRTPLKLDQAIKILDNLYEFCKQNHVFSQITFTGGNPILYPHFNELYREAGDRGFLLAVLGNPVPQRHIEEMIAIQKPVFYQVSLEGLQEHNDYMRGEGHFDRVLDFLMVLQELKVYSMVMLTLTHENVEQVIPFAETLRGRVDLFTFNRLAMIGEGVDLVSVSPEDYPGFLEEYIKAAKVNPHMSLKDNFFNLIFHKMKKPYTGGCTGFGCGAAFNFFSLLPGGEVHACRKLHSPIGNIQHQSFAEIYQSKEAKRYRAGSSACHECEIKPVCGGCLAVAQGLGHDIFTKRDPYCFKN